MVSLDLVLKKLPLFTIPLNFGMDAVFFVIRKIVSLNNLKRENIIIVSLNRLGDTVFTVPAVKQIINSYKTNIFIICYPESAIIYKKVLDDVNFIAINKKHFFFNGRFASRKARKELKKKHPKVIFDLTLSIQSLSLIFNSRAREIIGSNDRRYKGIYTHFTTVRKEPHLVDKYLDAIKQKINIEDKPEIKSVTGISYKNSLETILIHPFAGWQAKQWNFKKYFELTQKLNENFQCSILVQSGFLKSDVIEQIKETEIDLLETSTVEELIKYLERSAAFIGNDSGPLNIANMLGIPTFTIFGPTNPNYHIPQGNYFSFYQKKIKCTPTGNEKLCFTTGGIFGCPTFECINNISISEVYSEILKFMKSNGISGKK